MGVGGRWEEESRVRRGDEALMRNNCDNYRTWLGHCRSDMVIDVELMWCSWWCPVGGASL